MSDDWISMRCSLHGNRHVLAIAKHLAASQLYGDDMALNVSITIGALQRFWSWAQNETLDGFIEGVALDQVSSMVGVPGFGEALKETKWVTIKGDGIEIPQFDKYMGNGAKRRLKDARRKGRIRKVSASVRTKCGTTEQKKNRTEEKRRKTPPTPPLGGGFPMELQTKEFGAAWERWVQHRIEIRRKLTPTSISRQFAALAKIGSEEAVARIDQSIEQGWQGLFPPRKDRDAQRKFRA